MLPLSFLLVSLIQFHIGDICTYWYIRKSSALRWQMLSNGTSKEFFLKDIRGIAALNDLHEMAKKIVFFLQRTKNNNRKERTVHTCKHKREFNIRTVVRGKRVIVRSILFI